MNETILQYIKNDIYEIDVNEFNKDNNTNLLQEELNEQIIHTLLEYLDEKQTLDNTVCIITKGNRLPSILEHLDVFDKSRINVFIYEFEKELYTWLKETKYIKKVYVPIPADKANVAVKRKFVQDYMGAQKFWLLDDDLKAGLIAGKKRETGSTRYKIPVSVPKFCRIAELLTKKYTFGVVGYKYAEIAVAFCSYKTLLNNTVVDQCVLFDGEQLEKHNAHFTGDNWINETLDVEIQIVRSGLPMLCCTFGTVSEFHRQGGKNSVVSKPTSHIRFKLGNYIKWGEMIKLKPSKNFIIDSGLNYSKITEPITWDPKLLQLCKEGIAPAETDKIIEYLNNKNTKRTNKIF